MFERDASSYYELLEVGTNASYDEIDEAYQRIATYLSPDSLALYSMASEEDVARMRAVVDEAYRTLSDPGRRAAYDNILSSSPDAAAPTYPSVSVPDAGLGDASITLGHVHDSRGDLDRSDSTANSSDQTANTRSYGGDSAAHPAPNNHESQRREDTSRPASPRSNAPSSSASSLPKASMARPVPPTPKRRRLEPEIDIPELDPDGEVSGTILKNLRESAGASLNEVAEITKVSKRYLRALEENDFETLPAQVYVRGFAREYARILGLDAAVFAKNYMKLYRRYRGGEGA